MGAPKFGEKELRGFGAVAAKMIARTPAAMKRIVATSRNQNPMPKLIALELEPPYPLYFLATSLTSLTLPRWRNQKMASIPAETKGTPPDTKRRAGGTLR
jgi:hypothetical protein